MAPGRVGARRRKDAVTLAIVLAGDAAEPGEGTEQAVVGCIQYSEETDPDYFSAAVDIFVGTAAQGRGVGPDAMRTLVAWPSRRAATTA